MVDLYVDPIILGELQKIRKRVLTKDRDYVAVYDGEEGVGKSVLAMQHAKILDPSFSLDDVVFNADQFIRRIKDPITVKGKCILLDETFNSASSRSSLSEVNKSMISLATEMRQKNLFVLMVLPSFFDLDRYFALWRCRALFHVYFTPDEERHYITFDKDSKKLLYLTGKKTYSYTYPKAPFPPAKFFNTYVVDEEAYRRKKMDAFQTRKVSYRATKWLDQRNALIRHLYKNYAVTYNDINNILLKAKVDGLDLSVIGKMMDEGDENVEKIA